MAGSTAARPRIIRDGECRVFEPISLTERDSEGARDEDWIQQQLDLYPDLLPIEEISTAWGPLISLGREIPVDVGLIDNLYISPAGELTVCEAKLWRNPEARRKVVAQILDYAATLQQMSYEDLDEAVRRGQSSDDASIWERVLASAWPPPEDDEARFIDTVSQNLADGRFLLLIVGDGIRSDLQGLADLLSSHPSLRFHLELVELRLYDELDGPGRLIVPTLIGKTEEVTRAVVEVHAPSDLTVEVHIPPEPTRETSSNYESVDQLELELADTVGDARAAATTQLIDWWITERGESIRMAKQSITLLARDPAPNTSPVAVLNIKNNGNAEGPLRSLVKRFGEEPAIDIQERYDAVGFDTSRYWPNIAMDLTNLNQLERIQALLLWIQAFIQDEPHHTDGPTSDSGSD